MTPGPGVSRTVLPLGFLASGINCGVRRYRPDLGIILSDRDAVGVGVFTQSTVKAAPIRYCQKLVPAKDIRAILTNSGQANAVTGARGDEDNLSMVRAVAEVIQCSPDQVLIASTGVIGVPVDLDKVLPAIPEMVHRASDVAEHFALAIMTTDLVPKTFSTAVKLSGGFVTMTGIAKGSGMIHPNMATMLGYILTDAKLEVLEADALLKAATDESFNMISVDGDTSTNDSVFMLANGATGVGVSSPEDRLIFTAALHHMAKSLAQSIARDGEGATKLLEVSVLGAPSLEMARLAARAVTLSPLVKTAVHGADPNWGRVLACLGAKEIPEAFLEKVGLTIQGQKILEKGFPVTFVKEDLKQLLKKEKVVIKIDLQSGTFEATAWGCDLSRKYIDINADYTT